MKIRTFFSKIAVLILSAMMMASSALAMSFSQPVNIGMVSGTPIGGLLITGANWNNGSLYHAPRGNTTFQGSPMYAKGVAQFGDDSQPLYFYYDWDFSKWKGKTGESLQTAQDRCCVFSDKEQTKTKAKGITEGDACQIFRILTDDQRVLYLLKYTGSVAGLETYVLMGYQSNGTFVKYFDTSEIVPGYYGTDRKRLRYIWLQEVYPQGDTIVVNYHDAYQDIQNRQYNADKRTGAFRFHWDESAQWFGVEHVFY